MLSLVETGPVVLEKKIFKYCQFFFWGGGAILFLFPLGKGYPSFEET